MYIFLTSNSARGTFLILTVQWANPKLWRQQALYVKYAEYTVIQYSSQSAAEKLLHGTQAAVQKVAILYLMGKNVLYFIVWHIFSLAKGCGR
jgi:hypothetical protein